MLIFCPQCGNMLTLKSDGGEQRFACRTCPYIFPITEELRTRTYMQRKEVDDILGGAKAWENVDSIDVPCPKCEHPRAYFLQIQIRSADEPMSTFYKCCDHDCQHQWREK
ncbi:RNA polymerase III C11 subunit [Blastocladiella emersonii ATCC 22665]|nr:RNA polymerase III C11 subunit [Blastocladiella emersonii ATCC 22665]